MMGGMRPPRASAVIVALSTLIAVVTVSTVMSQLAPFDRAGAVLPEGPIVVGEEPLDPSPDATPGDGDASTPSDAPTVSTGDAPAVVAPAPAETVASDPEPEPAPVGPPATSPGNSGNAPGQTGDPGNSGNAPGNGKP